MTATAERVLKEIKNLPPDDLIAVWTQVKSLVDHIPAAPDTAVSSRANSDAFMAIQALYGCFKGRNLSAALLRERARERAHEEARIKERRRG